MGDITIPHPSGPIQVPDDATPAEIKQHLGIDVTQETLDSVRAQSSKQNYNQDVSRAAVRGLGGGVGNIIDAFSSPAGANEPDPRTGEVSPQVAKASQSARDEIKGKIGGKSNTWLEGMAEAGGEMAPAGLFGPKGAPVKSLGVLDKAGGWLSKMFAYGAAPGMASEGVGEVTKGQTIPGTNVPAEPWARMAGGLFGSVPARRMITPLPTTNSNVLNARNTLENSGVNLSAGQATGRPSLQRLEGRNNPDFNETQSKEFTKAATAPTGTPTSDVTIGTGNYLPTVTKAAKSQMDDVSSRNKIALGAVSPGQRAEVLSKLADIGSDNPQHLDKILDLIKKNTGWEPNMRGVPGDPKSQNMMKLEKTIFPGMREVSGEDYQRLRSQMWNEASENASSNPTYAQSLRDTASALDKGMEHSIANQNPNYVGAFQKARDQLKATMIVDKARSNPGEDINRITPVQLEKATRSVVGDSTFNKGVAPYTDLSQAGRSVMKPLPSGSGGVGTAAMTGAGSILGGLAGLYHGGFEPGIYGELMGAATGAAAGSLPGFLLSKNVMSPTIQAYLKNQTLNKTPEQALQRRNAALVRSLMVGNQQ